MTIEQIETHWQKRANKLSITELELELERLPTSPKTDNEIVGRATLMRRYLELTSANRPDPQAPPPDPAGMVEVTIPSGGPSCVQSMTQPRKYFYSVIKGDRAMISLPWPELRAIIFGTSGTAGLNGGAWLACNPHLQNRFTPNPPPPPPAPLQ